MLQTRGLTACRNTHLVLIPRPLSLTWLITWGKGRANPTLGIRKFNLRRSELIKKRRWLICSPFLHSKLIFFLFSHLQLCSQKEIILRKKKYWGGVICPPFTPPQVTRMPRSLCQNWALSFVSSWRKLHNALYSRDKTAQKFCTELVGMSKKKRFQSLRCITLSTYFLTRNPTKESLCMNFLLFCVEMKLPGLVFP